MIINFFFDKEPNYINKNKKEIIIITYVNDEETIKYVDINEDDLEKEDIIHNAIYGEINQEDSISKNYYKILNLNNNINILNQNNNFNHNNQFNFTQNFCSNQIQNTKFNNQNYQLNNYEMNY